jgi:hypothetical protein
MNNVIQFHARQFETRAKKNAPRATQEQKTLELIDVIRETFDFMHQHYNTGQGSLITQEIAIHIKNFYRELSKLTARLEMAEGNFYAEQKYQLQGLLLEEIIKMDEFIDDGEETIQ